MNAHAADDVFTLACVMRLTLLSAYRVSLNRLFTRQTFIFAVRNRYDANSRRRSVVYGDRVLAFATSMMVIVGVMVMSIVRLSMMILRSYLKQSYC